MENNLNLVRPKPATPIGRIVPVEIKHQPQSVVSLHRKAPLSLRCVIEVCFAVNQVTTMNHEFLKFLAKRLNEVAASKVCVGATKIIKFSSRELSGTVAATKFWKMVYKMGLLYVIGFRYN
ncbi:hypothetical protein ACJW30_06G035500 [Castanea mollissima]